MDGRETKTHTGLDNKTEAKNSQEIRNSNLNVIETLANSYKGNDSFAKSKEKAIIADNYAKGLEISLLSRGLVKGVDKAKWELDYSDDTRWHEKELSDEVKQSNKVERNELDRHIKYIWDNYIEPKIDNFRRELENTSFWRVVKNTYSKDTSKNKDDFELLEWDSNGSSSESDSEQEEGYATIKRPDSHSIRELRKEYNTFREEDCPRLLKQINDLGTRILKFREDFDQELVSLPNEVWERPGIRQEGDKGEESSRAKSEGHITREFNKLLRDLRTFHAWYTNDLDRHFPRPQDYHYRWGDTGPQRTDGQPTKSLKSLNQEYFEQRYRTKPKVTLEMLFSKAIESPSKQKYTQIFNSLQSIWALQTLSEHNIKVRSENIVDTIEHFSNKK